MAHASFATHRGYFWWIIAAIIPTGAWAIYHVSAVGIVLPGVIGWAATLHRQGGTRMLATCAALSYIIGIAAIYLADVVTHAYDPLVLTDDDLSLQITRAWAAVGILGAVGGAILGCLAIRQNPPHDQAEPRDVTDRRNHDSF